MLQGNKDKGKWRLCALKATTNDFQQLIRSDYLNTAQNKQMTGGDA